MVFSQGHLLHVQCTCICIVHVYAHNPISLLILLWAPVIVWLDCVSCTLDGICFVDELRLGHHLTAKDTSPSKRSGKEEIVNKSRSSVGLKGTSLQ